MLLLNYSTIIDPLLRDIRSSIPDFAGMIAGERVLDLCCGTGAQVMVYGMKGFNAVGIDSDPAMLKMAIRSQEKLRLPNVHFQLADATQLPLSGDVFDHASISFAIHDKTKNTRDGVIREMKRVVKHHKSLVFIDFHFPLPRNLWGYTARTVEFIAGGEHFAGFKEYVKCGGLPGILEEHGIRPLKRKLHTSGLIEVIQAANV